MATNLTIELTVSTWKGAWRAGLELNQGFRSILSMMTGSSSIPMLGHIFMYANFIEAKKRLTWCCHHDSGDYNLKVKNIINYERRKVVINFKLCVVMKK